MNTDRYKIYLAALLHDIGKFYQRADDGINTSEKIQSAEEKLWDYICPKNQHGNFGYQHVIWTHQLFQDHKDLFNSVRQKGNEIFRVNPFEKHAQQNNLVNLAIFHHYPDTLEQAIIQLADSFSSGVDRSIPESMETQIIELKSKTQQKYGAFSFKKVRLNSFFTQINNHKKQNDLEEDDFGYNLTKLDLTETSVFPKDLRQEAGDSLQQNYSKLWKAFEKELYALPKDSFAGFSESLLYLLRKYTSYIPSSTQDMRDVSLYEHLKSTAAFADALFRFYQAPGNSQLFSFDKSRNRLKLNLQVDTEPFLLGCIDLSGIQSFIYDIHNRKAAVSLKGRSFYLQLLIDSLIQRILDDTGSFLSSIVYSSGGKCFFVLPNIDEVTQKLGELRNEFVKSFYDSHGTKIYPCMAWIPFGMVQEKKRLRVRSSEPSSENTPIDNIGKLWKALADKTASQKSTKYKHLLVEKEGFHRFFGKDHKGIEPTAQGDNTVICAVSGNILSKKDAKKLDTEEFGEEVFVKASIYAQIGLGKRLKDADYSILFKQHQENAYFRGESIDPGSLGYEQYLFSQEELIKHNADFRAISSADTSRVRRINTTDFGKITELKGRESSYGFLFYGGNKQATIKDGERPKTFEELTLNDPNIPNQAFKRLGILKMDVDNLGQIFIKGLPEERRSFAAYATLSNQLDLFFSGYLNTLRNQEAYKDFVNILYSGGDDLFVVGRWDLVIEFAWDIREAFKRFVCGREDISLSGGIVLVGPKFPISKAAEMADAAEKQAKAFVKPEKQSHGAFQGEKDKNAICLFDIPVSWEKEFEFVQARKSDFVQWYKEHSLSKGVLNRIQAFYSQKQDPQQTDNWAWVSAYYFARKERKELEGDPHKVLKIFLMTGRWEDTQFSTHRALDLLAVAARWAELELRNEKQ